MAEDVTRIARSRKQNPHLHVVLFQPEIPANTGNIARLCGAVEAPLHLIRPLGFKLDDRHLRRAGLDYWHCVDVREHRSLQAFLSTVNGAASIVGFSRHAAHTYTDAKVKHGDYLLFGQETRGLPETIREAYPCYAIPIWGEIRSLNLSTAVGIVVYHYLHQMGGF